MAREAGGISYFYGGHCLALCWNHIINTLLSANSAKNSTKVTWYPVPFASTSLYSRFFKVSDFFIVRLPKYLYNEYDYSNRLGCVMKVQLNICNNCNNCGNASHLAKACTKPKKSIKSVFARRKWNEIGYYFRECFAPVVDRACGGEGHKQNAGLDK